MAYTTIDNPHKFFNTLLYTGDGNTGRGITGVGFQPDWLWIKRRDATEGHVLFDVVRSADARLQSNNTNAEADRPNIVFSFDSDGFSVSQSSVDNASNNNGGTYAAWNWKAGTTSGLSGGTITPSAYSINATSGFGIYKYTGTGSAGTIAHGLGKVPKMIIVKPTSTTGPWVCYHVAIGNDKGIVLNTDAAEYSNSNWASTTPTTSVISLRAGGDVNTSSVTYIAYVFCDVKGYSKFGSYQGTGNADGPFVHIGFKPAWVLIKRKDSTNSWQIIDNKRNSFNLSDKLLFPDLSDAESTSSGNAIDMLSNGFKPKGTGSSTNSSGAGYLYMAFAENPFVTEGTKAAGTAR